MAEVLVLVEHVDGLGALERRQLLPAPGQQRGLVDLRPGRGDDDLAPEQPYTLRAVRGEETVFTVQFSTPRKKPFINIEARTVCLILLFPFLGWLAWRKWKTRAQSGW